MTFDEISLRLGLDVAPVARALEGVKGMFTSAAGKMRAGLNSAFDNFAGMFTIGALGAQLKKSIDLVEQLQIRADNWGVPIDFVQDITNIGVASGTSSEEVGKLMNKFVQKLPNGSDPKEELLKLADRIAAIKDPAEKAKLAMDSFGKGGMSMLPILDNGRKGVADMGAQFSKFSAEEIKALADADAALDAFSNKMTVWTGSLLGKIASTAEMWGAWYGKISATNKVELNLNYVGGELEAAALEEKQSLEILQNRINAENKRRAAIEATRVALEKFQIKQEEFTLSTGTSAEKLKILEKRFYDLNDAMAGSGTDAERVDFSTKILDIEQKMTEEKKKQNTELEKAKSAQGQLNKLVADQRERVQDAKDAIARATTDRKRFTLEELAGSGLQGNNVQMAQQAVQLTQWARENRMMGRFGMADVQEAKANSISVGLQKINPFLKDPMEDLKIAAQKQVDSLAVLEKQASTTGLLVTGGEN